MITMLGSHISSDYVSWSLFKIGYPKHSHFMKENIDCKNLNKDLGNDFFLDLATKVKAGKVNE